MKLTTKFWIGIVVLIVLSPLGLILPEHFKAGSAWGEWGADEMQKLVGMFLKASKSFLPFGMPLCQIMLLKVGRKKAYRT